MPSMEAETRDLVELEQLLGGNTEYDGHDDADDQDDSCSQHSDRSGRIFYTQKPPTALQSSLEWVAVRCAKSAAHLTAYHPPRRLSKKIIFFLTLQSIVVFVVLLLAITPILIPSYSNPPKHYEDLRRRSLLSTEPGRANPNNEKVFIAASIYDAKGQLAGGVWGKALVGLIDLLGPENVYLSLYEDNAESLAVDALKVLEQQITCNRSIVAEKLDMKMLPHVTLPTGRARVKRIAFLAKVRNRALQPLDDPNSDAFGVSFDKLLYLNDVIFNPIDAANLLLSTNIDERGRTQYRAACATDFIDPFKYYDTFATRDLEGYTIGIPIYPWFTSAGQGQSRQDVLDQKDAVRVRSCWGGMVAFEAKWFQHSGREPLAPAHDLATNVSISSSTLSTPPTGLRFRAEDELYWEASECCLIQADLAALPDLPTDQSHSSSFSSVLTPTSTSTTSIFMNPYIRVAYTMSTYRWLPFMRHFERLVSVIHDWLNFFWSKPGFNPRRLDTAGLQVTDRVWKSSSRPHSGRSGQALEDISAGTGGLKPGVDGAEAAGGAYYNVRRVATPGGFCGSKKLLVLGDEDDEEGAGRWWGEHVPLDSGV